VKLYIDDDSNDALLVAMLRKAGHDVMIPSDVGMSGSHDAEHLLHARHEMRALLSRNYRDFEPMHKLVIGCAGTHGGIILIRQDNDPRKDMTRKQIVSALKKVEMAYADLTNELITLNDWR
jgi:hypothetical protein